MAASIKYLALGDSYTIGEKVAAEQNFPNQAYSFCRSKGLDMAPPRIVATTGWTTDELIGPMEMQIKEYDWDWVSLLIGVNNQYRGRSATEYDIHFRYLASRALAFAQNNKQRVIVLSIPDWGLTPFNKDRDAQQVSAEIDEYNRINKEASANFGFHYIDITPSTRAHASDPTFLAEDLLHPSAKEYEIWAQQVAAIMLAR